MNFWNVSKAMQNLDRKHGRYQAFKNRQDNCSPEFWDRFKFRFKGYYKAGVKELPTFTRMDELKITASKYNRFYNTFNMINPPFLYSVQWLSDFPMDKSKEFLCNFNKNISAIAAKGLKKQTVNIEIIKGIAGLAAEGFEDDTGKTPNVKIGNAQQSLVTLMDAVTDKNILYSMLLALCHASYASGNFEKAPSIGILQMNGQITIKISPGVASQGINLLKNPAKLAGCAIKRDVDGTSLVFERAPQ